MAIAWGRYEEAFKAVYDVVAVLLGRFREDVVSVGGVASPNGAGVVVVAGVAGKRVKVYDCGFHAGADGLHCYYFGTGVSATAKRLCSVNKAGLVRQTFVQPRVGDVGDGLYLYSAVSESNMPYDVGYVQE
jgi:hypothetical protein